MTNAAGGAASVRLRCAPGVSCRLRSDGECEVEGLRGSARVGQLALPVLSVFLTPVSLAQGVSALEAQLAGTQSALDLLTTIVALRDVGALVDADGDLSPFQTDARSEGFGALPIHAAMLSDVVRTQGWMAGIAQVVRPGDRVLEIGCGTGVLAVAAARAGASEVYAVEATPVAELAKRLAADNGVGDVVSVVQGWSTAIQLPERADVLVSEILDDDPFREGVLEATADAAKRLLHPGARILPRRITLLGALVELPEADRSRHGVTSESLQRWQSDYGISFAALQASLRGGTIANVPRKVAGAWRQLSAPVVLADVVLDGSHPMRLDVAHDFAASDAGECHGVVTYFTAELTQETSVTTDPWSAAAATHWLNPTLLVHRARPVVEGDTVRVRYRYPGFPSLALE